MKKFATYIRVSTQKQGNSKLGLEAQTEICQNYIDSVGGTLVKTFQDVESGKSRTRKGLWDAISFCQANNCTLVIAKLDRLARDVEFTFKVINTGVQIHFCDMPQVNTMILGVFASVAQYERELISQRTKAALDAKKARGETWERNTNTIKANKASAESRREKALENPSNVFFFRYITNYERHNEKLSKSTDNAVYERLVEELNTLGATTASGMKYNVPRFKAMLQKVKNMGFND